LSPTAATPLPVAGWRLQAVGWKLDGTRVRYADIKLHHRHGTLSKRRARRLFQGADRIGFLVTADDPGEVATKNARYRLRINGSTQRGGRGNTNAAAESPAQARRTR
jgi:hypothetical protein